MATAMMTVMMVMMTMMMMMMMEVMMMMTRFVTSKNPEEWARAKDQLGKVATIMFVDHEDKTFALIMVMALVLTIMAMVTNMGMTIQQHKSRLELARARLTTWHSTGLRSRSRKRCRKHS